MTMREQEHEVESGMNPRQAAPTDLPAITALLTQARLPNTGVEDHLEAFVVIDACHEGHAVNSGDLLGGNNPADNSGVVEVGGATGVGGLVGVGGLEVHGRFALLRSLAVKAESRRQGIASMICDRLEEDAVRRRISRVYLLTETAESFFARRGYSVATRAEAPAEIAATEEFTTLCPDSAVLMVRTC